MDGLDHLATFVAVVDKGGQTAAARHLGRSLQAVNRSLMALEQSVGVELVQRTTRQSSPTEAGLAFYRRIKPALADIADAKQEAPTSAPIYRASFALARPFSSPPSMWRPRSAISWSVIRGSRSS